MNNDEVVEEPTTVEVESSETDDSTLDAEAWKKRARDWEKRSKENLARAEANEAAAQRVTEIDEAAKSDLQKLQERAERAELELKTSQFKSLKAGIAAEHGVSPEDAELLLTASDEDGLRAQATALAARTPKTETPKVGFQVEGLQDRDPSTSSTSYDELAKSIFGN